MLRVHIPLSRRLLNSVWLRVSREWPWAWVSSERSFFPKRCHPKLNTWKRQAMVISHGAKTETWISSVNARYIFHSWKDIPRMLTWVVLFSSFEVFSAAIWVDEIQLIADCLSEERRGNNTWETVSMRLFLCSRTLPCVWGSEDTWCPYLNSLFQWTCPFVARGCTGFGRKL